MSFYNKSSSGAHIAETKSLSEINPLSEINTIREMESIYNYADGVDLIENAPYNQDVMLAHLLGYCGSAQHRNSIHHASMVPGDTYLDLLKFFIERIPREKIRGLQARYGITVIRFLRFDVLNLLISPEYGCTISQLCGFDITVIRIVASGSSDMQDFLYEMALSEMRGVDGVMASRVASTTGVIPKFQRELCADVIARNQKRARFDATRALEASSSAEKAHGHASNCKHPIALDATLHEPCMFALTHAIAASVAASQCEAIGEDCSDGSIRDMMTAAAKSSEHVETVNREMQRAFDYAEVVQRLISEHFPEYMSE